MLRRHSALEIDIGEQRPRRCIRSAHADPPRCRARMESYSLADVSRREVQQPARSRRGEAVTHSGLPTNVHPRVGGLDRTIRPPIAYRSSDDLIADLAQVLSAVP